MGVLGRIRESLSRTKQQIVERFDEIVRLADAPERRSHPIDVDTIDALEELLISADIGVAATDRILKAVKTRSRRGESLRDLVKQEIREVFAAVDRPITVANHPRVTLVVGVNGTGKTTTIGKLANLLKAGGQKPLICAADTFRAAAVEQLEIWANRAGVDIVRAREGADPAAVVFDAISAFRFDLWASARASTTSSRFRRTSTWTGCSRKNGKRGGGGAAAPVKEVSASGHAEPRTGKSEARHQRQLAPGVGPRRQ